MKYVSFNDIVSGMILAEPIYDMNKRVKLLNKGVKLERSQIDLLTRFDIEGIYVEPFDTERLGANTSVPDIQISDYSTLKLVVEVGILPSEFVTTEDVFVELERFLNSLQKFNNMSVVHSVLGERLPANTKDFTEVLPKEFLSSKRYMTFRATDIAMIVFHGDNKSFLPKVNEIYWFRHNQIMYCIKCTSAKNKLENYTPINNSELAYVKSLASVN